MSETINEKEYTLEAAVEAMLFVAGEAVSANQLATALGVKTAEVMQVIENLTHLYAGRGLAIQESRGRFQLTTSPQASAVVENFLGLDASTKLSRPAIEALTIIAYRQPITRPGIDSIRGVNSDGVIKTLVSKGLIEDVGRAEGPGRPVLYATSDEFLQHFGLNSIAELPPFVVENEVTEEKLLKD